MEIETVSCNSCGGPLDITAGTNYVTCGHCGSRLAVKRTASSAFTESLGEIAENTAAMTDHLANLNYHAELERIDREWEQERRGYLTTTKRGQTIEPNGAGAVIFGVIMAGFGLFWTVMAFSITSHFGGIANCFPLFGLIFVGFGIWMAVTGPKKAAEFEAARRRHQARRAAVLRGDPRGATE